MRKDKQPKIPNDPAVTYNAMALGIGKIQRLQKSFLNITVCTFGLFLFWFIIGKIGCGMIHHKTISLHEIKDFLDSTPEFSASLFSFLTTFLSLICLYTHNKIQHYASNFPLIKLFAKSSLKKAKSKSSKNVRKKS